MKITMLRNPARFLGCELTEGQTGDVSEQTGELMLKLGIAQPATESPVVAEAADAEAAPAPETKSETKTPTESKNKK